MNAKRNARALALTVAAFLISTACTGGGPALVTPTAPAATITNSPSSSPSPTASTLPLGGNVTFGAEGWPECLNPITACADNAWTYYTVLEHVLPRAMQLDPKGNFVPSPLLVEAPSLNTGDLAQSPFTVTFKIRPEAVWDDGTPITASDFDFTWRAILGTPGSVRTAGYDQIESIETTDPHSAIIRFKSPYADWPDLFGGAFGFILKKAAFSEEVGLFPSMRFAMLESIPFSGGPFILKSWTKEQAVLVRNDNYFSTHSSFGTVTFVQVGSSANELMAILARQVSAMYVEPPALRLIDMVYGFIALKGVGAGGVDYEGLRFDLATPPLDDPRVREALMYAIDRQLIIDQIIKFEDPEAKVLNCGFVALPRVGPWCQTVPFARFAYDAAKARSILEDDGYDCSATPCTKDGKPLEIGYGTIDKSFLRTETRRLLIPRALDAGFKLTPPTSSLPPAIYDSPIRLSPDPSVTDLLACSAIPAESNGEAGENIGHWCNPDAERLLRQSDAELAPALRAELLNEVYQLQAEDLIGLPLYVVPKVSLWLSDELGGPIAAFSSTVYGMFFNMGVWYPVSP
jgi:peptide/nickel transport system substrate-binding protein